MPSPPNSAPFWKQEVNRRLAAHRNRHQAPSTAGEQHATKTPSNTRAALAAARVAARYARTPSYAQLETVAAPEPQRTLSFAAAPKPAAEAPKFMSDAEAAAPPPMKTAPPKVEAVYAVEEEAAPVPMAALAELALPETQLEPVAMEAEPLIFEQEREAAVAFVFPETEAPLAQPESRWIFEPEQRPSLARAEAAEVEPLAAAYAPPVEDNLIVFPSEPSQPRRSWTLSAEPAYAVTGNAALSIFEVEPATMAAAALEPAPMAAAAVEPAPLVFEPMPLALEPMPLEAPPMAVAAPAMLPSVSRISGIRLDQEEQFDLEPDPAPSFLGAQPAPIHRRLMALVVDASLIGLAFVGAATLAAINMDSLPAASTMRSGSAMALLAIAALYMALFTIVSDSTPGMRYAGLRLRTLNNRRTSREQRWARLGTLILSLAPLGLGAIWACFDEQHLSWHDRLSQTYQRKS